MAVTTTFNPPRNPILILDILTPGRQTRELTLKAPELCRNELAKFIKPYATLKTLRKRHHQMQLEERSAHALSWNMSSLALGFEFLACLPG